MVRKEVKTNAMRLLERLKIAYRQHEYEYAEFKDGMQVADLLGLPRERVFKTLVTEGADRNHYVFVLPVAEELDMEKAAKSVGVKALAMLRITDLTRVTGYIRGGCTAVGMKKPLVTRISAKAQALPRIVVSGGRPGSQIELAPDDLLRASNAQYADITL